MITVSLKYLKDWESSLLDSPQKPVEESLKTKDLAILSINLLNSLPQEKEFFFWEVPVAEKLTVSSVFILVKKDHTLPQELEPKVVNSKEPEAEDDSYPI